jgi:hypothetical protein
MKDHVSTNKDNNINKTSSPLSFILFNLFNNNYFKKY